MGVYIKGMEMPANCFLCPLSVLNGERLFCEVTKEEVIRAKRSSCCPLVPVPPHGALMDRDDFFATCPELVDGYLCITNDLVVIPAEEGE